MWHKKTQVGWAHLLRSNARGKIAGVLLWRLARNFDKVLSVPSKKFRAFVFLMSPRFGR